MLLVTCTYEVEKMYRINLAYMTVCKSRSCIISNTDKGYFVEKYNF